MFSYFAQFVTTPTAANRMWPVTSQSISDAEARLGFTIPSQLKRFWEEAGSGFYAQGTSDKEWDRSLVNRIVGPRSAVDLLLDPTNPAAPAEGFVDDVLPFFDTGENTYLVLCPFSDNPNSVYWPDGEELISDSLEEFFAKLQQRAAFYRGDSSSAG